MTATSIVDDAEIARVVTRYASGMDHRDWGRLRGCFGQLCSIDYSSWSGAPATTMAANAWVDAVREVVGNFDATQHLVTNHDITHVGPAEAVGVHEVQARHWFSAESMRTFGRDAEPDTCTYGGHYVNRYVRMDDAWVIAGCRLDVRWRMGDESLFALARHRQR